MARTSSACTSTTRLRKFVSSVRIVTAVPAGSETLTGEVLSLLQSDYYFSSSVAFFQISDSSRDLAQLISPVDNRFHFSRLHHIGQDCQVLLVRVRHHHAHLLAHEWRQDERVNHTPEGSDPPAVVWSAAADHDIFPFGT